LDIFDQISRNTPLLANIKPSGEFLMEDMFYAGGIPALMKAIEDLLHLDTLTVTGKPLGDGISDAVTHNTEVIRTRNDPLYPEGGTVVLRGNLAPDGAVLKQTAASSRLLVHRGRAVVFQDRVDLMNRIDDPALDVDADSVLVLKNAGPKGGPGMPEWGQLPIPKKLLKQGVDDMVRISDARMSGTSFGTVVLHIAPESATGGPLAFVQDNDTVELNVPERRLELKVSEEELASRRSSWCPPKPHYRRGYGRLFLDHVLQANMGCDFDFLQGKHSDNQDLAPVYARMGHS